jgi:hypothetical protein
MSSTNGDFYCFLSQMPHKKFSFGSKANHIKLVKMARAEVLSLDSLQHKGTTKSIIWSESAWD